MWESILPKKPSARIQTTREIRPPPKKNLRRFLEFHMSWSAHNRMQCMCVTSYHQLSSPFSTIKGITKPTIIIHITATTVTKQCEICTRPCTRLIRPNNDAKAVKTKCYRDVAPNHCGYPATDWLNSDSDAFQQWYRCFNLDECQYGFVMVRSVEWLRVRKFFIL